MRYDKVIYLLNENTPRVYDTKLGRYVDADIKPLKKHANISNLSVDRQIQLFGDLDVEVLIARIQGRFDGTVSNILMGDTKYKILSKKLARRDTAFYIRELKK